VVHETAALDRPPRVQGLLQRVEHEAGVRRPRDPPADNAPRISIDHKGNIDEAGPGRDIGEIRDPEHVRARRLELPVDAIERACRGRVGIVVRTVLPRTAPCRPMARISRATVQRATLIPSRPSRRQTFRTP
jgi:hypothetical protein